MSLNTSIRIKFEVNDREFAITISTAMSKLLNKKYIEPRWDESDKQWVVEYCSKAFVVWHEKQTLDTLKQYIEYNKGTVTALLRGLYDAEGCNDKCKRIYLSNTNVKLLRYVQYLLSKYFNIDTRGPYLTVKAGTIHTKRNGERIESKHDGYQIHINKKEHVQRFLEEIGFTITRKQLGLKKREFVKQGFFKPPFSDAQ